MGCFLEMLDLQVILQFGDRTVLLLAVPTHKIFGGQTSNHILQSVGLLSGTDVCHPSIFSQLG